MDEKNVIKQEAIELEREVLETPDFEVISVEGCLSSTGSSGGGGNIC